MSTQTEFRFYETPELQPINEVVGHLVYNGITPSEILEDEFDGTIHKYVEARGIDEETAQQIAGDNEMWLEVIVHAVPE